MNKLDSKMKNLIANFNAGSVASINTDGTPAVSPKATFVIIDDSTIAFGDIRSPGTIENLKARPQTEINFIDVIHRRAVRVSGTATIIKRNDSVWNELLPAFERLWKPYLHLMKHFVVINIEKASMVTSPGYDIGLTQEELRSTNLNKLNNIY